VVNILFIANLLFLYQNSFLFIDNTKKVEIYVNECHKKLYRDNILNKKGQFFPESPFLSPTAVLGVFKQHGCYA